MEMDFDLMKLAKAHPDSTDGLFPIFHHETRIDQEATDKAGRPIYEAVPYVEIIAPGNDKEKVNRRVKEQDKQRWPEQWRQFTEGREELVFDGMPVTEWPMVDKNIARTLTESNVYTVEQLANVPDVNLQMLGPGMMALKSRARRWVKEKEGQNEELQQAQAEIIELRAELQAVKDALAQEAVNLAPKKRGRRPKVKTEESKE